jgi:hypothetical protein
LYYNNHTKCPLITTAPQGVPCRTPLQSSCILTLPPSTCLQTLCTAVLHEDPSPSLHTLLCVRVQDSCGCNSFTIFIVSSHLSLADSHLCFTHVFLGTLSHCMSGWACGYATSCHLHFFAVSSRINQDLPLL